MNENEFDLAARAWLEDGPTQMSDRALLSALEEIHTTRQRRAVWPARRATPVSNFARVPIAAVLVVAVGLLAINVVPRLPDGSSVGGPSPSAAQAVDFPDLTTTFVSPRNGFSIKHPDSIALTPAEELWGWGEQPDEGFDVLETGLAADFKGASTKVPDADSIDDHVSEYAPGGCGVPRSHQTEITIDGQSGRISECPNRIEATVVAGGQLYLFILSHDRSDARAIFDAWVATIDLTPETAVDFPALTTTFVSPTNGFSFRYRPRGDETLRPAKELWDPASDEIDDAFDVAVTGLAAAFYGASTEIPDGVSIDEWVDASVIKHDPDGCMEPRSQQAVITVDGQSGRTWECPGGIGATVVAGGRLYLFILGHDRSDARALFDAFVATIDLRPEGAAVPSSTPSS
jgi:hypothetical protein